jgi:hypothetical protein
MHHHWDTILDTLRQDLPRLLDRDFVEQACRDAGHRWRSRVLTPWEILLWFLTQVTRGNTAVEHVALLGKRCFTGAAYCQARMRLPRRIFHAVLQNLAQKLTTTTRDQGRWRGHRTWLVDGSGISMPDTPEFQKHFGQPSNQAPGCGFPVAKILALFHAGTGMLMDIVPNRLCSHEMSFVSRVHPSLGAGDVLVGDRGFCSFAHLVMLTRIGVFAVFRVHQKQIVDFTPHRPAAPRGGKSAAKGLPRSRWLRGLGVLDQVVEWFKPATRPEWMSAQDYANLPETLTVRELRYRVERPGFRTREVTLVTTLLDAELYPVDALAQLYWTRWRVELHLRELKTTMHMDVLKCKTVEGVLKELLIYAIVYNLVRLVMLEASRRQEVDVERISFVDALRWLASAHCGDPLPRLVVNPLRPDRLEPRVRKRRPKQYPLMQKPRAELRKALLDKTIKP